MKNINVRIIDENTLELAQDGKAGDRIDLKKLHESDIDKSQISSALSRKIEQEKLSAVQSERELVAKQKETEIKLALANQEKELKDKYFGQNKELEKQVAGLKAEKQSIEKEQENKIKIALAPIEKQLELEKFKLLKVEESKTKEIERITMQKELEIAEKEKFHKQQIETLEEDRDRWKKHQHSLNIKDFGNSLEEYCDNTFAEIQNFLPNATFGKDTTGDTMGDRIYKEVDKEGNEILSIMFEMKDERADSKTKQKNKDFFSKLDKDRANKKCEYAVLVSLLEADNKNYDAPFHVREYKKMFVIRPQHFKYIIENLRLIKNELSYANMQLAEIKKQDIDFTNFQEKWNEYLTDVGSNIRLADKHFTALRNQLIKERDDKQKQIDSLDAVGKNLNIALRKAEKVDFQKMAKDSPTLLLQFVDEIKENAKTEAKGKKTS